MRILICLDKFRGSASAREASDALAAGIAVERPDIETAVVPIADGGEGTIEALVNAGYERRTAVASGPLGASVQADFAVRNGCAVIEMAQASGLHLIAAAPDPLRASTFGTGELIRAALDLGCHSITLTAGGSASTDAGAGMLQALGVVLSTADGQSISSGGGALLQLETVDVSALDARVSRTTITLATDVDNPLLGPHGAAAVFGPQKGAGSEQVALLEVGLRRFADLMHAAVGRDFAGLAGAGAAGGTGFGAMAGLGAIRTSGVDFVLRETGVERALAATDLVIVGEGRLDEQSLGGKAPVGVAALARRHGIAVVAVAGELRLSAETMARAGIDMAYSILDRAGGDVPLAMSEAERLLVEIGHEIARSLTLDGLRRQRNRS